MSLNTDVTVPDSEGFYLTVTSDNNSDIFLENKVSDFNVRLANPIFLEHDEWKVGVSSLNYPYDFANIGKHTSLKIYCRGYTEEITLPSWFCDNISDLCQYLTEIITLKLLSILDPKKNQMEVDILRGANPAELLQQKYDRLNRGEAVTSAGDKKKEVRGGVDAGEKIYDIGVGWKIVPRFTLSVVALRRVMMTCNVFDFDICFSEQLLQILGFNADRRFTYEQFEVRDKIRSSLFSEWDSSGGVKRTLGKDDGRLIFAEDKLKPLYKFLLKCKFHHCDEIEQFYNAYAQSGSWQRLITLLLNHDPLLNNALSPTPNIYSSPDSPPSLWIKDSEFWGKYISEEEYQETFKDSTVRDMTIAGSSRVSFSYNTKLLICISIIRKFVKEQLLLKPYFSKMPGSINPFEMMFLYSNLVKPEPFNSVMSRLLAVVKTDGNPGKMSTFAPFIIQYKKLEKMDISNFKVLIASDRGEPVPFTRGPVVLTLHFVRE